MSTSKGMDRSLISSTIKADTIDDVESIGQDSVQMPTSEQLIQFQASTVH